MHVPAMSTSNRVDAFQLVYSLQSGSHHCLFQGVKFDPQTGSVLHIEMARSNSRRKRKPGMQSFLFFKMFPKYTHKITRL